VIPRGCLDLTWLDLVAAAAACLLPGSRDVHERAIAQAWQQMPEQGAAPDQQVLATLSVRSAWDLLLGTLALPAGSEVLLSAITIPDMVTILREHQLVPVPLPVDPATLRIKPADVTAAITPRTKAILFAPLYGSRASLGPLVELARADKLLVIEDGAQCFGATCPANNDLAATPDVLLLSFGLIKTATALGGGLLITRDVELAARLREQQKLLPVQSRWDYFKRLGKGLLLKVLSNRLLFGMFVGCCNAVGLDHDQVISQQMRSFSGAGLFARLRRQPSTSLLRVLRRRLEGFRSRDIQWRQDLAQQICAQFQQVTWPGSKAHAHTHWAFPVRSHDPAGLIQFLREQGFDATQRASSLVHVSAMEHAAATPHWLSEIVYLPLHPAMSIAEAIRLGQLVEQFESGILALEAVGELVAAGA
jgi:perosamine synthetase